MKLGTTATTFSAIWGSLIRGTVGSITRAGLFRVARTSAGAADASLALELALLITALLVGRITDTPGGELASLGITARIIGAPARATAVTIFAAFNDTVTALAACDSGDVLVVCETLNPSRVSTKEAADVADAAWREVGNAASR